MASASIGSNSAELAIQSMQGMVQDTNKRLAGYMQDKNLLLGGIWYPTDYFDALTAARQGPRLEWLRNRGDFYNCHFPNRSFRMIERAGSATGVARAIGVLKSAVKDKNGTIVKTLQASEGITLLQKGPAFLDCANLCQLALYDAVLQSIGEEKFNILFDPGSQTPFALDQLGRGGSGIMRLVEKFDPSPDKPLQRGDVIFITNVKEYAKKHIHGNKDGQWAIYLGDDRAIGHGLPDEGMTIMEVGTELFKAYNSDPRSDDHLTEEVARKILNLPKKQREIRRQMDAMRYKMTEEEFQVQGGGTILKVIRLRQDRIDKLRSAKPEKVRQIFDKWAS